MYYGSLLLLKQTYVARDQFDKKYKQRMLLFFTRETESNIIFVFMNSLIDFFSVRVYKGKYLQNRLA